MNHVLGLGGSAIQGDNDLLRQDGEYLSPFHSHSSFGGKGCSLYDGSFDTPGGFGGGGGGCSAGGGGGGYSGKKLMDI